MISIPFSTALMFVVIDKQDKEIIDGTLATSEKDAVDWFLNRFVNEEFQQWSYWEETMEVVPVEVKFK